MTEPKYGEWQPIKTAPRDGTTILVYHGKDMFPVVSTHWAHNAWQREVLHGKISPTHWMPLPPEPAHD